MRKLLVSVLVLSVVCLALVGCDSQYSPPGQTSPPAGQAPLTSAPPSTKPAAQQTVKLVFANWMPPQNPVSQVCDKWARDFEQATGGRYTVEVVHGGALASIPKAYDVLTTGVADISHFVPSDTEKPFPASEVSAMAWSYVENACQTHTRAFNTLIQKGYFDKEFADFKILFFSASLTDEVITVKQINKVADLRGVKIVSGGGPLRPSLLKEVGAVPVFGGPPDMYPMIEKGIAEGQFMNVLGAKEFDTAKFVKFMAEPLRIGRVQNIIAMSRSSYNKLPADVQAVIDKMDANLDYSLAAAKGFDDSSAEAFNYFTSQGGSLVRWEPANVDELSGIVKKIWDGWIADMTSKGYPAQQIVSDYYQELIKLGANNPALGYSQ